MALAGNIDREAERAQQWMAADQRSRPLSARAAGFLLIGCALLLVVLIVSVDVARRWGLFR